MSCEHCKNQKEENYKDVLDAVMSSKDIIKKIAQATIDKKVIWDKEEFDQPRGRYCLRWIYRSIKPLGIIFETESDYSVHPMKLTVGGTVIQGKYTMKVNSKDCTYTHSSDVSIALDNLGKIIKMIELNLPCKFEDYFQNAEDIINKL